jgi:hypothetical protein
MFRGASSAMFRAFFLHGLIFLGYENTMRLLSPITVDDERVVNRGLDVRGDMLGTDSGGIYVYEEDYHAEYNDIGLAITSLIYKLDARGDMLGTDSGGKYYAYEEDHGAESNDIGMAITSFVRR